MPIARRSVLIGLGLAGLVPGLAMAGLKIVTVGIVESITGSCTAEFRGEKRQLAVGSPIFRNDVLRTGEGARLAFRLGEATHLVLQERSRLSIGSLLGDHRTGADTDPGRG